MCALGLLPSGDGIAGGASPSPTILKKLFRNLVGEVLGPPADHVPAATSSATPGAGAGPQQRQFFKARAQWPGGNLDTHSDFARRKSNAKPKG